MSGIEIAAIISCAAAVISAYRDGGRILRSIKEKRERSNALQPTRFLEESLERAPRDIEIEKDRIAERFGPKEQLQASNLYLTLLEIRCELQDTLLRQLSEAFEDDAKTDFQALVNASDLARARMISTLCDLQRQMLEASSSSTPPIASAPPSRSSTTSVERKTSQRREQRIHPEPNGPLQPHVNVAFAGPVPSIEKNQAATSRMGDSSQYLKVPRDIETGGSDLTDGITHLTVGQVGKQPSSPIDGYHPQDPTSPTRKKRWSISSVSSSLSSMSKFGRRRTGSKDSSETRRDSGVGSSPSPSSPRSLEGRPCPKELLQTENTYPQSAGIGNTQDEPEETSNPWAGEHSAAPQVPPPAYQALPAFPIPLPENDYLGFCKGAWTFNISARPRAKGERIEERWYPCQNRKCNFGAKTFAPKVLAPAAETMKLRWAFLARSHVCQTDMRSGNYSYRCIFCVLMGKETEVLHGVNTFLMHIAEHRTDDIDRAILKRVQCISGRIADDREIFALNLFPLAELADSAAPVPVAELTAGDYALIERGPWAS